MRTGVSLGRVRASGVKGCVLSDLVPTRCRQARKATHSRPGTAAYLCPPLRRPGPLMAGTKHDQRGAIPVQGGTDPSFDTPRTWPRAQRQPKPLQWAIPTLTGTVPVINATWRAAAPHPAHRRAARPPPNQDQPRLTKTDATGVVSPAPYGSLHGWLSAAGRFHH